MPVGIIADVAAVLLGGLLGTLVAKKIPERIRKSLFLVFGLCSFCVGISGIMKMNALPAVILSIIVGTLVGECLHLQEKIEWCAKKMQEGMGRMLRSKQQENEAAFREAAVTAIVLFCFSSTAIYGSLQSGLSGEHTILLAKAILDFFTAVIFAASMGSIVAAICIPQLVIMLALFYGSTLLMPLISPQMLGDFLACGGIISFAIGFRLTNIKPFAVANMIPAMILVFPISYLWGLLV